MPRRREHIIENNKEKKFCPTCKYWKILTEFNKQSSSWDNLARMCRNCHTNYKRNKRKTDPSYKLYDSNYNEKYKKSGRRKEVCRLRYINKKQEIIKKCIDYNKKRYHEDTYYKFHFTLRCRLNKALKKYKKENRTIDYLGCTIGEARKHLEKQFEEGMTWKNHGDWHIDHVRPCASFDFSKEEDIHKCFHFSNLQPLWAKENMSKSDYYSEEEDILECIRFLHL